MNIAVLYTAYSSGEKAKRSVLFKQTMAVAAVYTVFDPVAPSMPVRDEIEDCRNAKFAVGRDLDRLTANGLGLGDGPFDAATARYVELRDWQLFYVALDIYNATFTPNEDTKDCMEE
jgi:hypothetical protein